eukprot:snap_masked-scaffold_2-processed-gene-27.62-mRNA-1 protein AED:1.00 eAED:1.00 QI:0/0/0/0/1/1/4/0/125
MFPFEREVSSLFFKPLGSRNSSSASCCENVQFGVHDLSLSVPLSEFKVLSVFHGNGVLGFPLFPYYHFCLFEIFMDIILCHSCIYSSYLEVQPVFVVVQDSFSVRDFHSLLLISNKLPILSEDVL